MALIRPTRPTNVFYFFKYNRSTGEINIRCAKTRPEEERILDDYYGVASDDNKAPFDGTWTSLLDNGAKNSAPGKSEFMGWHLEGIMIQAMLFWRVIT